MFPQEAVEEIVFRLSAEFQFAMDAQKAELLKPIQELQAQVKNLEECLCLTSAIAKQKGTISEPQGTSSPHHSHSPNHHSPSPLHSQNHSSTPSHHSSPPSPMHIPHSPRTTQVQTPSETPIDTPHQPITSPIPPHTTQVPNTPEPPIANQSTSDSHPPPSPQTSKLPTPPLSPIANPSPSANNQPLSPSTNIPSLSASQPSSPTTKVPTPPASPIASPSPSDSHPSPHHPSQPSPIANPIPSDTPLHPQPISPPQSPPILTQIIPLARDDDKTGENKDDKSDASSESAEEIVVEEIASTMVAEEIEAVVVNIARSYMDSEAHRTPPPQQQPSNAPPNSSPSDAQAQAAPNVPEKDDLAEATRIVQKHGIPLNVEPEVPQPVSVIPAEAGVEIIIGDKPSTGDPVRDKIQEMLVHEAEKNKGKASGQSLKGWRTKTTARKDISFKVVPKASPDISKNKPKRIKMMAPKRPNFEKQNAILAAELEARRKANAVALEEALRKNKEAVRKKAEFEARRKAWKEAEVEAARKKKEALEEKAIQEANRKAKLNKAFKEVLKKQKEAVEKKAILEARAKAKLEASANPELKTKALEIKRKERQEVSEQIRGNPELKGKKVFEYKRKINPLTKSDPQDPSKGIVISESTQKDPQEEKSLPIAEPVIPKKKTSEKRKGVTTKKGMTKEERAEQIKLQKDKFFYSDSSLSDYPDEEFYNTASGANFDSKKNPPLTFENSSAYKSYMASSAILPSLDSILKVDSIPYMHNLFDESESEKEPSKKKKEKSSKRRSAKQKSKYYPGIIIRTDPSYLP